MQLYTLKLVTVVAENVIKDKLSKKLLELGATGYTVQEVQGNGPRGMRQDQITGSNFRLECICSQEVAEAILLHMSKTYFDKYACIAWVSDVGVVRGKLYLKDGK